MRVSKIRGGGGRGFNKRGDWKVCLMADCFYTSKCDEVMQIGEHCISSGTGTTTSYRTPLRLSSYGTPYC